MLCLAHIRQCGINNIVPKCSKAFTDSSESTLFMFYDFYILFQIRLLIFADPSTFIQINKVYNKNKRYNTVTYFNSLYILISISLRQSICKKNLFTYNSKENKNRNCVIKKQNKKGEANCLLVSDWSIGLAFGKETTLCHKFGFGLNFGRSWRFGQMLLSLDWLLDRS